MINNVIFSHLKEDLRARVSDYLMENKVSQKSTKILYSHSSINLDPLFHDDRNLIDEDYHIDASFDHIRETGFWDDGSEIKSEWWFRNSLNETNVTHSFLVDQVKL